VRCVLCGEPGAPTRVKTFIGGQICAFCLEITFYRPAARERVTSFHAGRVRPLPGEVFVASRTVVESWQEAGLPCSLRTVFEGVGRSPEEATHVLSAKVKNVLTGGGA